MANIFQERGFGPIVKLWSQNEQLLEWKESHYFPLGVLKFKILVQLSGAKLQGRSFFLEDTALPKLAAHE